MSERIVNHPKYGRGEVKQSRYKGFELYVQFQDGLTRWVRLDEVEEMGTSSPLITTLLTSPPTPPTDEAFKSRRIVEAFRLGIVPHDCVDEFTFGRQDEIELLMDWLNSQEEATLLLVGEYGSGKTHLLNYAYGRALQEGFAVAYVEMDANEAPFHKPKRVYSRLVQTFRYRSKKDQQTKRFRDFLREVLAKGALKDHKYFGKLIGRESDETLWDWVEARELIIRPWSFYDWIYSCLPGLYDYSTAANIYCYLLNALGWAAKEVLGLKGLLLIFDEAEAVNVCDYTYQVEKSYNFLKALIRTADNDNMLSGVASKSGLYYCGVGDPIPFLYQQPSGLKLLFAFTPIYALSWIGELQSALRIDLQPLTDDALKEVFEHVCLLYNSAYDSLEEGLTISAIFRRITIQGGRTRMFVKGSVEALDLVRLNYGSFRINLSKSIDELELSIRSVNCLRSANIKTVADLVQRTEQDLLKIKNFGRKSLNEIEDILAEMGLQLGAE